METPRNLGLLHTAKSSHKVIDILPFAKNSLNLPKKKRAEDKKLLFDIQVHIDFNRENQQF